MSLKEDLIFHLVEAGNWKAHQENGLYKPGSLEQEGYIHCSKGDQVEATANRYFKGEEGLLLIVIDRASLSSDLKFEASEESGEVYPHIYGPLNNNAVIDKIKLDPDENGTFIIEFDSFE